LIILRPRELTWINDQVDDPFDLCAHGKVQFEIDGVNLVRVEDGEWTVSAAALFLLRTLKKDHTVEAPLFENVIPHCGSGFYAGEGEEDVKIIECPSGINFQVIHVRDTVQIIMNEKKPFMVASDEWRNAVLTFSQVVREFYAASTPKTPVDDSDEAGFEKFMVEWRNRHEEALHG
jgi:hypothetical protein